MSEQVNQDTSFITKFNSADYELTVALVNEFFNYPIPNGIVVNFLLQIAFIVFFQELLLV
jgi:hypothetical protein